MLIEAGEHRSLGSDSPRLRFGEAPTSEGTWAGRRLLYLAGEPAFELSFWCGTCPYLFRRLEGANGTASIADLAPRLEAGLADLDKEVIARFGTLLSRGSYAPILLEIRPRYVRPVLPCDYFAEEQVETWGTDSFWGLPEYPRTPYYRTFSTRVDKDSHLYEFIVPMVPPSFNDRGRVDYFKSILQSSSTPTVVAVSVLDVCQPADARAGDNYAHWGLTHFLLDGHHKLEAAAAVGRPLRLLTLLSVGDSLATPHQVNQVAALRAQPPTSR